MSLTPTVRAPCLHAACLIETNIRLLPDFATVTPAISSASKVLVVEESRRKAINLNITENYLNHPLSHAVDGDSQTYFKSSFGLFLVVFHPVSNLCSTAGSKGDLITLDLLRNLPFDAAGPDIRLLVDASTMQILIASRWDTSPDGSKWVSL